MRRHAKASSAGSTEGNGSGRGLLGRAFATRGASGEAKGSGAPSSSRLRGALAVLALTTFAFALTAASASAETPVVKIGTVSEVLGGSAHVSGEVDPGADPAPGVEAEALFTFEYSTDNVNWSGLQFGNGNEVIGEGFHPVSADLEGLKGATKYFVRLFATNFADPAAESTALEFETLPVAASSVLKIDNASQVGFTTAKATGEVLRPEPSNPDPAFDAKCEFEYITDEQFVANEGNGASGFEGATPISCNHNPLKPADGAAVEAILTGLAPNTTYHLRLSASNAGGADSKVAASTFTTQALANAPTLAVEPATEVGFSKAQISATVNPQGGNVNLVGDPVSINWELQYTRADEPANWQLAEAGVIEGEDAESTKPVKVPASPKQLEGLHSATEYKVRLIASYGGQTEISPQDSFTTLTATAPAVTIEAASAIGASSAHLSGHVNPGNEDPAFDSTCEFDYATQEQFDDNGFAAGAHSACDVNPVTGTILTAVKADPTGLEPGTVYHLRIRAENQGGEGTAVAANFETDPVAPTISATAAHDATTTTASLNAQINPGGDPTTYRFEYLSAEEFEAAGEQFTGATSTPESASIGENAQNHPVSAPITGLQPDTAYRFRAVATNPQSPSGGTLGPVGSFRTSSSAPDTCANAEVRAQQGTGYLPDCRAYEMVSPANKHGNEAGFTGGTVKYSIAAADGDSVLYGVRGPVGSVHRGLQLFAVGHRQDGGWSSTDPLVDHTPGLIRLIGRQPTGLLASSDFKTFVWEATNTHDPSGDPPSGGTGGSSAAIYRGNVSQDSLDWLTEPQIPNPVPPPGAIAPQSLQVIGGSPDLDTVYFSSAPTLLPSDATRASSGGNWGLYEYSDGALHSAGTLPDGSEDPGGAVPASSVSSSRENVYIGSGETFGNVVSRDGATLFFVSPDPGILPAVGPKTELYVRRGGHSTLVSHEPDGTTPAPSGVVPVPGLSQGRDPQFPHQYAYASPDGSTAIFQSTDPLTPDAPNDSTVKSYRYVVKTNTVSYLPGVKGNAAQAQGATVVAASEDGSRFLFNGTAGLAVWDQGTIKTILPGGNTNLVARASASGSAFVFTAKLSTGIQEIYRYDVAKEKTVCVSCPPDDVVPSGATLVREVFLGAWPSTPRGISADANRIFFDTADPLVPQDTNGVSDVYEWTPSRTSLISSGHSPEPSYFLDNGAEGNDVFFTTAEGLDSTDTDHGNDVYDARAGGGFLRREITPCAGEECRSGASTAPAAATAATNSFAGAANPKACPKGKVRRNGECVKQRVSRKHHKKKSQKRTTHKRGGAK